MNNESPRRVHVKHIKPHSVNESVIVYRESKATALGIEWRCDPEAVYKNDSICSATSFGVLPTGTSASVSASIFDSAVPVPDPETMAPA